MTGQDPTESGFTQGAGTFGGRFGEWGFSGDGDEVRAKRAVAFEQWRGWEAAVFARPAARPAVHAAADAVWPYTKPPAQ
ncbi:MAG: hypothetical protein U0871_23035 [Gemmataceae bacterium]